MTSHSMQRYSAPDFSSSERALSKMMMSDYSIPLHFGGNNSTSPATSSSYMMDNERALPKGISNSRLCPTSLFVSTKKLEQFVSPLTEVNLTFHTKQNPPARESKATFLLYFVDQQKQLIALEAKLRREVELETQNLQLVESESRFMDGELVPAWERTEYHQPTQRRERRRHSLADMFAAFDFRDKGHAEMVYAADDWEAAGEEIPELLDDVVKHSKGAHKIKRFFSRTASKVVKSISMSKPQDDVTRRRASNISAPLREPGNTINSTSPKHAPLTYTVPLSSGSSKAPKPKNRDSGISMFTSMTSKSRTATKRGSQGSLSHSLKQFLASNPSSPRDSYNKNNQSSTTLSFIRKSISHSTPAPHTSTAAAAAAAAAVAAASPSRSESQRSRRRTDSKESFQAYRYPRLVHVDAGVNPAQSQQVYYGQDFGEADYDEREFGAEEADAWESRRRSLPVPPFPIGQVGIGA